MAITKDLSPHLSTLYENDVLPFLESQGDVGDVREVLSALVNCKGMLPGEFKWVLQSAGNAVLPRFFVVSLLRAYRSGPALRVNSTHSPRALTASVALIMNRWCLQVNRATMVEWACWWICSSRLRAPTVVRWVYIKWGSGWWRY